MPFRATFACLWCGTDHATRTPDDLEGWAQLCPTCVGKAGGNNFLRSRLREALIERGAAAGATRDVGPGPSLPVVVAVPEPVAGPAAVAEPVAVPEPVAGLAAVAEPVAVPEPVAGPAAVAEPVAVPEPVADDDWYLRRGAYSQGPIHDAAFLAELDAAGRWLDALPIHGTIVQLAAGTGWFAPLLAGKGELSLIDASAGALDRARERLVAHGLRAHLHVGDPWSAPDAATDTLLLSRWLACLAAGRVPEALAVARSWLKPGGRLVVIDGLRGTGAGEERASGSAAAAAPGFAAAADVGVALAAAGFVDVDAGATGRFLVLATALAPD